MVNILVKVIILLNYKLWWAVANHEHSDVLWMHASKVIVCKGIIHKLRNQGIGGVGGLIYI
jgi:hypothetical protein